MVPARSCGDAAIQPAAEITRIFRSRMKRTSSAEKDRVASRITFPGSIPQRFIERLSAHAWESGFPS